MKKLLCAMLALVMLLMSACSSTPVDEENPDVTPTPSPTPIPTATWLPTPAPTPVPVVDFDDYQYFIITNTSLAVSFKYPTHWINEPGKSSIRYTEPVNIGDTPAQLTVTSKYVSSRQNDDALEKQMKSFLALVEAQVDDYKADKKDLKDNVEIMNTEGVRQKYTARNRETGEKITGYALMVYVHAAKRIYLLHFTAPDEDYDELSGVIDVIRDSMKTT